MSIFEDAVIGAKNVTVSVGEKAGRLVDISRLRLSAAEISRDIARRYEAMGRAVYDANKVGEDVDGIIAECAIGIDALYTRLDDINIKIARLKEKKYCTGCGALIDDNALFCSRCGARIEHGTKAKPAAEKAEPAVQKTADTPEVEAENAE